MVVEILDEHPDPSRHAGMPLREASPLLQLPLSPVITITTTALITVGPMTL
jgi:hypothetical protein